MASYVHCRVVRAQVIQPQDELYRYIGDKHPNIQSALPQSQLSQRLSHDGDRPSRTHLQDALSVRPPLWQPYDDVCPCDSHKCPSVDGHAAWPVLHPAVSDQSVLGPFGSGTCSQAPPARHSRHSYPSQACFQRHSSWPAHMSFRSSLKCLIINCSVFFFHRESHFWHQFVTYRGFYSWRKFISVPKSQHTTMK
jgi:hypothetical protein